VSARAGRGPVDLAKAARAIDDFLGALGLDPKSDPELRETGRRVAQAYAQELLDGYDQEPAAILAEHTASSSRGLVMVAHVPVATMCPHHLLPALGVAHVGYLPGERVVGLGALGLLVDCFARRLTLQEDLCQNVADALITHLGARGAGCAADLAQGCVTARGERRHGARSYTVATAGVLATDEGARREWLALVPGPRAEP
jgi:GTP cyclohydrolase I